MESGSSMRCLFVFPLLARESAEERRGHGWRRMDLCRDREKYGRKASLLLYILLSLSLIN